MEKPGWLVHGKFVEVCGFYMMKKAPQRHMNSLSWSLEPYRYQWLLILIMFGSNAFSTKKPLVIPVSEYQNEILN